MKISKRIQKIIEYIDIEDKVADVGCDHGYLGLGCLEKGIKFVQNIDNKKGPLSTAMKNLSEYKNNQDVIYTLSDGLDELDFRVDTVVISGMGGDLITQIINKNLSKALKLKKIIVVAHSKLFLLRQELTKNFVIVDESIIEEKNKFYEIIVLKPGLIKEYQYEDFLLGPILKHKKDELFILKWTKRLKDLNSILSQINGEELKKEKKIIEENISSAN